jgi:hypothetical protein
VRSRPRAPPQTWRRATPQIRLGRRMSLLRQRGSRLWARPTPAWAWGRVAGRCCGRSARWPRMRARCTTCASRSARRAASGSSWGGGWAGRPCLRWSGRCAPHPGMHAVHAPWHARRARTLTCAMHIPCTCPCLRWNGWRALPRPRPIHPSTPEGTHPTPALSPTVNSTLVPTLSSSPSLWPGWP